MCWKRVKFNVFLILFLSLTFSVSSEKVLDLNSEEKQIRKDKLKKFNRITFVNRSNEKADEETRKSDFESGKKIAILQSSGDTEQYIRGVRIKRYEIKDEGKFGGDVLEFSDAVSFGHINTIVRIITGYIKESYNYTQDDSELLALYMVYYNLKHRQDDSYFLNTFSNPLTSNISKDKIGLDENFEEWKGQTQFVIPLEKNVLKSGGLDIATFEIEDQVNSDLDIQKDGGETRKKYNVFQTKKIKIEKEESEKKLVTTKKKEIEIIEKKKSTEDRLVELSKDPETNRAEIEKLEIDTKKQAEEIKKIENEKSQLVNKAVQVTQREEMRKVGITNEEEYKEAVKTKKLPEVYYDPSTLEVKTKGTQSVDGNKGVGTGLGFRGNGGDVQGTDSNILNGGISNTTGKVNGSNNTSSANSGNNNSNLTGNASQTLKNKQTEVYSGSANSVGIPKWKNKSVPQEKDGDRQDKENYDQMSGNSNQDVGSTSGYGKNKLQGNEGNKTKQNGSTNIGGSNIPNFSNHSSQSGDSGGATSNSKNNLASGGVSGKNLNISDFATDNLSNQEINEKKLNIDKNSKGGATSTLIPKVTNPSNNANSSDYLAKNSDTKGGSIQTESGSKSLKGNLSLFQNKGKQSTENRESTQAELEASKGLLKFAEEPKKKVIVKIVNDYNVAFRLGQLNIAAREFIKGGNTGFLVIGKKLPIKSDDLSLFLLDPQDLEIKATANNVVLHKNSPFLYYYEKIIVYEKYNEAVYLTQFNMKLEFEMRSPEPIDPDTNITIEGDLVSLLKYNPEDKSLKAINYNRKDFSLIKE
jgi:hypothetical protein